MKKAGIFIFFLIQVFMKIYAQSDLLSGTLESMVGYIPPGKMPFWLRSNQFGSIPLDDASLSIVGSFRKEYKNSKKNLLDWGLSLEGRANIGQQVNINLIEGYGKIRVSVFEVKAGRIKEFMGLCDSSLSVGSFSVSGNSIGIPKVQVSIPEFCILPFLGGLFAFKGNFSHGWIGETKVHTLADNYSELNTFFHQKSLYGRLGKTEWKWKLIGGFNHQAFWGSEKEYYGSSYTLSPFEAYMYVVIGRKYGTENFSASKIGNHLGSIDIGFEYNFRNVRLFLYRQNIYDIGALYYLANIRDGLNGLRIENINNKVKRFCWEKILVELFYTKNQAGELWSPLTPSGDENYYNNDQYIQGWSYKDIGIGNPFISTRTYTRDNLTSDPYDYFINNRVAVIHFGFEGIMNKWVFKLKTSYSLNYGTFGTSEVGHTVGKVRTLPKYGIFSELWQISTFFEGNREFNNNLNITFKIAFDKGQLYYNSMGFLIGITKTI
jgi:hypothetical protein